MINKGHNALAAAVATADMARTFDPTGIAPIEPSAANADAPIVAGFAPSGLPLIRSDHEHEYNWQFVKMVGSVGDLTRRLESLMNAAVRPLSSAQVKEELVALSKRTVKSRRYIQDPLHGAPGHPYPVMVDPRNEREHKIFAVRIVWEQNRIFVASALLFSPWLNPAAAVIEKCWDRFSVTSDVYLSGLPYRADTPSLFAVQPMKRVHRPNVVHNYTTLDPEAMKWVRAGAHHREIERSLKAAKRDGRNLPPWVTKEAFVVNSHVDQYATRVRLHRIALPWNEADLLLRFDLLCADEAWKAEVEAVGGGNKKYPEDAYKDLFNTNRSKHVRDAVAEHGETPLAKRRNLTEYRVDDIFEVTTQTGDTRQTTGTVSVGSRLSSVVSSRPTLRNIFKVYREIHDADVARCREIAEASKAFESEEARVGEAEIIPATPRLPVMPVAVGVVSNESAEVAAPAVTDMFATLPEPSLGPLSESQPSMSVDDVF